MPKSINQLIKWNVCSMIMKINRDIYAPKDKYGPILTWYVVSLILIICQDLLYNKCIYRQNFLNQSDLE